MKPGDVISRYRITGRLGAGGMGVVYQAEDLRLQRSVALKFLPQDSLTEQGRARFLNEARAAALARHPNICPIHDIDEADGELFIVMAFLEGETLQRIIARGPIEPARVVPISMQVASGLACAHGLGIIHRDIKSSNILIDRTGLASILDFGLALSADAMRVTVAGTSVGTPAYMSPEQARGDALDHRTDLWSLGVVMFEMLTGVLPFRSENHAAMLNAIIHDPPPKLSSMRAGVPPELERIVAKALQKNPASRWKSADELWAALKLVDIGSSPVRDADATRTLAATPSVKARFSSSSRKVVIGGVLAAGLGAAGVYQYGPWRPSQLATPVIPAAKHVAVLPFQATGEGVGPVADGMVEILSGALTQFDGVTTVPPGDLRRGKISTPEGAHRYHGVTLAITGTAQPAGDQVRFVVTLTDAVKLREIANRTFFYDPKNPLASRDQAVAQVAQLLHLQLPVAARSAIVSGDPPQAGAYSAYIEGRGFLARPDLPGNIDRAVSSFTSATRQDPKYALAYAGLADAYLRKTRATGDPQWASLASQNAEYAERLDSSLAMVHSVLGAVYTAGGRQADAIAEYQKAMELAPGNAEAPRQLAEIYNTMGRFQEAEALYIRSRNARPTDWQSHLLLGLFYYERERYEEAISEVEVAKSLTPDNDMVRRNLGVVYRMSGRYEQSIQEYQQALRIRSNATTYAALGGAYFYQHRFQEAVAAVEAAIDLDSNDYRYWGNLGIYCRWSPGSEGKSVPALRRAIELATKLRDVRKADYNLRADLAEYKARLGDTRNALAEVAEIPEAVRAPLTARLAIVYELSGQRSRAIAVIKANLKNPASLNQIKDDPDLAEVWREANRR